MEAHQLVEDLPSLFLPPSTRQKDLWLHSGFLGCKFRDNYSRFHRVLTCLPSPGNHSVTQSLFGSPCQPLSGGFDSGFIYVPTGLSSDFPEWNLTITDDSQRKYRLLINQFMSEYSSLACCSYLVLLRTVGSCTPLQRCRNGRVSS